jgi:hypothetical protein
MLKIVFINFNISDSNYAQKLAKNIADIAHAEIISAWAECGDCIILATEENAEKICDLFEDRNPSDVDMYSVEIYEGDELIRKEFHARIGASSAEPYVDILTTNGEWEYHYTEYEEADEFMETLEAYVRDENARIVDFM